MKIEGVSGKTLQLAEVAVYGIVESHNSAGKSDSTTPELKQAVQKQSILNSCGSEF